MESLPANDAVASPAAKWPRLAALARALERPELRPWSALGVFVLATAVRLWFNLVVHPPGRFVESDMWVYDHRAKNLLAGTLGPWDTFTPRGYPAILAVVYALGGDAMRNVAVLQALMGGAVAALTVGVGLRLLSSNVLALAAAILVGAHLPLVLYGGFLLSEIPFAFFLMLAVYLFLREGWPAWFGGCLAFLAAVLVRPNLLPALVLVALWAWRRRGVGHAVALVLCVGLGVGLVSWSNSRLVGERAGVATNGGLNFYLAFREVRGVEYQEGNFTHRIVPIPNLLRYQEMERVPEPFWREGYFYARGLELLREDPRRLARSLDHLKEGLGLGRQSFWPGWKGREDLLKRYGPAFFFVGILPGLLYLPRLLARRRSEALLVGAFLVPAFLTLAFFLGDPRMRVPFDPLFILLSVAAFDALLLRFRSS